jgi:uncharacterized surface protein with fasciclin (FAS1) repeats
MMKVQHRTILGASFAALAVLGASACSSGSNSGSSSSSSSVTSSTPAVSIPAGLIGSGCADYVAKVQSGPGSVASTAQESTSVAVSNNPLLTTFAAAVSGKFVPTLNLVDLLDNGGQFTVIAPTDAAFAKLDPTTTARLKSDANFLATVLTYHLINGPLDPSQVVGTHGTVLKDGTVNVTGSGADLKFNASGLVCGGIRTTNAIVYLVDTVMMPPTG